MRLLRRSGGGGGSSLLVGIILLLLLLVFAGSGNLPRFVSSFFPQFYEGVPCSWLRAAQDRGNHQSLLGRSAEAPLTIRVSSTAINTSDPAGNFYINIILTNESLGTVGIIYNPNQVIVGDNNTSGLGVIFNPAASIPIGSGRADANTIPEDNIRLLGPRQRCVHTIEIPNTNVSLNPGLANGSATVRGFYRNNVRGQVLPTPGIAATPIYSDQGLWTGYIESDAVTIAVAGQ